MAAPVGVSAIKRHSHLLEEDLVMLVAAAALHLVIQLRDDLVLELQSGGASANDQPASLPVSLAEQLPAARVSGAASGLCRRAWDQLRFILRCHDHELWLIY